MSTLGLVTQGQMPLCPLGLNTLGQIYCDGASAPDEAGHPGSPRRKRKKFVYPDSKFTPYDSDADIIKVIRDAEEIKTVETDDAVIDRPVLPHINKALPLTNPQPIDQSWDDEYRELVTRLRIAEIKRHALIERLYAEELMRLEEELAVLLLLA